MKIEGVVYSKYFKILLSVFLIIAVIEFVFSVLGMPIGDVYIAGIDLDQDTGYILVLRSLISSLFISGCVNFALILKLIKRKLDINNWPAVAIVIMTIFFPLEIFVSMILVVPNILVYGIKSFKKNKEHRRQGDGSPVS